MNPVQATRGQIQAVKESQSGKTLSVTVNGNYYSTKNWDFRDMIGQTIEFVPDISEWQGNTITWINDYVVPSPSSSPTAADAMNQAMAKAPQGGQSPPQPPPASAIHGSTYLPMTSNLVAHAIAAGLITDPSQIYAWANTAFAAAKNCLEPTAQASGSSTDGFDDDIPF